MILQSVAEAEKASHICKKRQDQLVEDRFLLNSQVLFPGYSCEE